MVLQFNRKRENDRGFVDLINIWWRKHSNVEIPDLLFSDFGFFAFLGDKPIMASFFYPLLGTDLCLWGYQVTNPDSSFEERTFAIDETATAIGDFAKGLGYKMLVAYPGNKAIVKRLEAVGFIMGDEIVTQAFKGL